MIYNACESSSRVFVRECFLTGTLCADETIREKVSMAMLINISVRHGDGISDVTREKIESKVEKLKRFYDRISSADITIDFVEKDNPVVDLKITSEPQKEFIVTTQAELFAALDEGLKKMEQQLKKFKEKLTDRRPE